MASEDAPGQERTEQATPHRRRKAHEEGQVPRSAELSAAIVLLAGTVGLATTGGPVIAKFAEELMARSFLALSLPELSTADAGTLLQEIVTKSIVTLLPFLAAILVPVLLIDAIQSRGVLSFKPATPDFSRVNPLSGFKKLIGAQGLFTLLKAIVKVALIGLVMWKVLDAAWGGYTALAVAPLETTAAMLRSSSLKLALASGGAFLLIAAADYAFQIYQHEKQLKMTKQEVIQERKEQDGDPLIKSRMQAIARALARKRMLGQVKTADVIVTNPTHIAVALRYDTTVSTAPIVVAMGERKLAERIKALGKAAGVPLVENRPLARALLATAKLGQPIPPALYAAVAEVLAYVYRRRANAASRRRIGR